MYELGMYEPGELAGDAFPTELSDSAGRQGGDGEDGYAMTGFYPQHDFNYFDL
jgi:hypothetical protein